MISLFLLLTTISLGQTPPDGPAIPLTANPTERVAIQRAAIQIERGEFSAAEQVLKQRMIPPTIETFLDLDGVDASLQPAIKAAVRRAVVEFNPRTKGFGLFKITESEVKSHLTVRFSNEALSSLPNAAPRCIEFVGDLKDAADRRMTVVIALKSPSGDGHHEEEQFKSLILRGMGMYLGLPEPDSNLSVFEAETHAEADAALVPDEEDLAMLRTLAAARRQLLDFARQKTRIRVPRAALSVEPQVRDAGNVWRGDVLDMEFTLRNTGDSPLELFARPGCGCTGVVYDRVVPPNGQTILHAKLATAGFRGKISKVITLSSNDPERPIQVLTLNAEVRPIIRLMPEGALTMALEDEGPSLREFTVDVGGREAAEITRLSVSPSTVTATFDRTGGTDMDKRYTIRLKIPQTVAMGQSRATVVVFTNSPQEKSRSIPVTLIKGIAISGLSASLGQVKTVMEAPRTSSVSLRRPGKPFQIVKIESADPKLEVVTEALADGSGYRVLFRYAGGWELGTISREVTIHTDDPKQPTFRITVLAQVVPGD